MKYPISIQTFEKIIKDNYVYVDKTDLVYDLVQEHVCFLSRPRRFGKTLWMTTLKTFLEIDPNNPGNTATQERYFKNLDIFKEQEFCSKYMGAISCFIYKL